MADANLSPMTDCQVIQKLQVPETMDLPEVIPETESKPETVDTANDASDKENEPEILEKESTIHPAIYAAEPESKQNHPVATQNTKSVTADENYKTGAAFLSPTAFPSNKSILVSSALPQNLFRAPLLFAAPIPLSCRTSAFVFLLHYKQQQ